MRPNFIRKVMLATAACVGIAGFIAPSGQAADPSSGFLPFAKSSPWDASLAASTPIAANSANYVRALVASVRQDGAWINTGHCGMPEYWAAGDQSTVKVILKHPSFQDPALQAAWDAVPIPPAAKPADCPDRNFAVLQKRPDGAISEWEFWSAHRSPTGQWYAAWGGATQNVLTGSGSASPAQWTDQAEPDIEARHATYGWDVTASGISMIAGVITNSDLASGHIDHALAIAVHSAAAGRWLWPAQRTDGSSTAKWALPEGAHLRLNSNLDISALHLSPLVRMLAQAAQRYGIIVRDQTYSANVFYAEPPASGL